MKKILLSALFMGGIISSQAQNWVSDSVTIGAGYANRSFYSLENGVVGSVPFNNRDFLVDVTSMYSASIRINGGFNAALYKYTAGDTADWSTLDTAGLATSTGWVRARDNRESISPSAFETGAAGHPNYGWGEYNDITHNVTGNRLFVYKTVGTGTPGTAVWKKIWIKELSSTSLAYTILVADLNGANEETITVSKQGVTGKNFVYYSFATGQTSNDEPAAVSYDLVFSKFEDEYSFMGGTSLQAVTGVEVAPGAEVATAAGVLPDAANANNYTLAEDLYGIGSAWKTVNTQTFLFDIEDSLSYFVKDQVGGIWQIRFTGFIGSSAGKYKFEKRKLGTASVEEVDGLNAWTVFPNPAAEQVSVLFTTNVADNAQFTLLDLNGRTVLSENFAANAGLNQYGVDLGSKNLPAGIYVATLRAGNVLKTTKLIIQ